LNAKLYHEDRVFCRAEIIAIDRTSPGSAEGLGGLGEIHIKLKVIDGELKGRVQTAVFGGEGDLPKEMTYKIGDRVYIGVLNAGADEDEAAAQVSIYDIDNTRSVIFFSLVMLAAIIVIGRVRGVASLGALIVTIILLFAVFIPLTLKGYPPLPVAVGISIVSIFITLPIIAGITLKAAAAIIGASIGIILSSLLAVGAGLIMHLSGIVTNDMLTVFYASDVTIDLRGLALSGMIIAALGAIMDICVSISSAVNEIYRANPEITEAEAFRSALTIGRDILGSMVNTLVLAYAGSSLSLILFISLKMQPGMPVWMIINYNPVLTEIVKSIIGSIAMFISIPVTAVVAARLFSRFGRGVR
jgi:uncharacterized membrane protein